MDGRTTKKLITHLKPNTFYNFVLTNRGSSLGGLQQTVTAWTAFNLLSGKPSVAPKPDTDGFILVYLPDGQSPVPVQYARPPTPGTPHTPQPAVGPGPATAPSGACISSPAYQVRVTSASYHVSRAPHGRCHYTWSCACSSSIS